MKILEVIQMNKKLMIIAILSLFSFSLVFSEYQTYNPETGSTEYHSSIETPGGNPSGGGGNQGPNLDNAAIERAREELKELEKLLEEMTSTVTQFNGGLTTVQITKLQKVIKDKYRKLQEEEEKLANEEKTKAEPPTTEGDPVFIVTGQYTLEETDLSFVWGINKFDITRSCLSFDYPEGSFGRSWNCSLDERLVFGIPSQERLNTIKSIKNRLNSCWTTVHSYINYLPQEAAKIQEMEKEFNQIKTSFIIENVANKKTLYGNAADYIDSLNYDQIIHVSENGGIEIFTYDSNENCFKPDDISLKSKIKITYNQENGTFNVKYLNGTEKTFSREGLPLSRKDRYGLTVDYSYDSNSYLTGVSHRNKEILTVKRDESGKITSIKNNINDECFSYEYENSLLVKVTDAQKDVYRYEYDNENDITVLIKPDESRSLITYSRITNNDETRKVVSSHIDEEGYAETYGYDETGSSIIYTDADGMKTTYQIENNHIVKQEADGNPEITWHYDNEGNVISKTDYFGTSENEYDAAGRLMKLTDENDAKIWKYENKYGFNTEYVDEAGNVYTSEYDDKGNCIYNRINQNIVESVKYTSWGSIKEKEGNGGTNRYEYNSDYQIISDKDYSYTYNENGNLILVTDKAGNRFVYNYEDNNKKLTVRNPWSVETVYYTNNRKDLEKIVVHDLMTDFYEVTRYVYDKRHLIKEILTGSGNSLSNAEENLMLQKSFIYTAAGRISKEISWNYGKAKENDAPGICREYVYDFTECTVLEKTYFVDEDCNKSGRETVRTTGIYYEDFLRKIEFSTKDSSVLYEYGKDNQFKAVRYPDGKSEEYFYDNSGRITEIKNIYGGIRNISYSGDMNISGIKYEDNTRETFRFDRNGFLEEVTINGEKISFSREDDGLFKRYASVQGLGTKREVYDCLGNMTEYSVEDSTGKKLIKNTIAYENCFRKAKISESGIEYENNYDCFGRCISSGNDNKEYEYDLNGNIITIREKVAKKTRTTRIEYNALNQISYIKTPSGNEINYFHDASGNVVKQTDSAGTVWEGNYYENGKLKSESGRLLPLKEYFYDKAENLTGINEAGDVVYRISYENADNRMILTDAKGNSYSEYYDASGRLTKATDRLGNSKFITYGINEKSIIDFNGRNTIVKNNPYTGIQTVNYSDDTQEEIRWNILNQISSISSPFTNENYMYENGMLKKQTVDGREYLYAYDAKGRKRTVRGNDFNEYFTYNDDGSVKQSVCNELSVSYVYDDEGREISSYSTDGSIINKEYDSAGRLVSIQQKNKNGSVNFAEYYIYDDNGRIVCISDKDGNVTLYEYDKHGRISKAVMPYEKEIEEQFIEEYSESGDVPLKTVIYRTIEIPSDKAVKLKKIWSRMNLRLPKAQNGQMVWTESYSYDANGNRIKKETPSGTIYYYYDKENRLVKYGNKQYVNIVYDKNGNMITKDSIYKNTELNYSISNRVTQIVNLNKKDNVSETYNYTYDALSRRITKSKNGRQVMRTVYDGFSLNPMSEYRISGKSQNVVPDGYKSLTDTFFPEQRSFLYVNDILRGQTSSSDTYVFCNDLRGSIRSVKSVKKMKSDIINYDVNGNPSISSNGRPASVQNEISSYGLDRMFCGKSYDSSLNQYDFGYRSYSPSHSGFISSDPAFDGYNWYSYCANDPVNFYDPDGRIIHKIDGVYIMNDFSDILGNEPENGVKIAEAGCYITTFANLYTTAVSKFGSTFTEQDYSSPRNINDDKTLFQKDSGNLNYTAMDKIFGNGNWDYWTKSGQGSSEKLLERLNVYEDTKDGYMVVGIFDLSSASPNVPNHMVGINGLPNENGIFEDIVPTSKGDKQRLADKDKKKAYSIDNLKEFRVVKINEYCGCKEGD